MRKLRKAARYIPSFCASSHWLSHWEEKRRESGSTFSKRGFIRLTMLTWETSTPGVQRQKEKGSSGTDEDVLRVFIDKGYSEEKEVENEPKGC